MTKPKYNIEFDIDGGYDLTPGREDRYSYLSATTVDTSGNTLLEVINDAIISTSDKDGGEGPSFDLDEVPTEFADYIIKEIVTRVGGQNA